MVVVVVACPPERAVSMRDNCYRLYSVYVLCCVLYLRINERYTLMQYQCVRLTLSSV